MKKYILAVAAIVLLAGVSNAQVEKKQPANKSQQVVSVTNKNPAMQKKNFHNSNVTP